MGTFAKLYANDYKGYFFHPTGTAVVDRKDWFVLLQTYIAPTAKPYKWNLKFTACPKYQDPEGQPLYASYGMNAHAQGGKESQFRHNTLLMLDCKRFTDVNYYDTNETRKSGVGYRHANETAVNMNFLDGSAKSTRAYIVFPWQRFPSTCTYKNVPEFRMWFKDIIAGK